MLSSMAWMLFLEKSLGSIRTKSAIFVCGNARQSMPSNSHPEHSRWYSSLLGRAFSGELDPAAWEAHQNKHGQRQETNVVSLKARSIRHAQKRKTVCNFCQAGQQCRRLSPSFCLEGDEKNCSRRCRIILPYYYVTTTAL